jgi:hypothetical protein
MAEIKSKKCPGCGHQVNIYAQKCPRCKTAFNGTAGQGDRNIFKKYKTSILILLSVFIIILLMKVCGGGDSSDTTPTPSDRTEANETN